MTPTEKFQIFRTYVDLCKALDRAPSSREIAKEIGQNYWWVLAHVYPWLRQCDGLPFPVCNHGTQPGVTNNPAGSSHLVMPVDRFMEKNNAYAHWG